MYIKSILPAVALALAATLGSVSAADQFTTLEGIQAKPMSVQDMAVVRGTGSPVANPRALPPNNGGTFKAAARGTVNGAIDTFNDRWFGKASN